MKVLTIKPTQLIFVVLQRKYSPEIFGSDNSQDQTDAAVEGISLFNTARGAELGTGRTAWFCSLKAAAATEEAGLRYMGVCNTQSGLDPHRTCSITYSTSSIVPVTFTPTLALSLVTKIVCRSLEYVFASSRIFSVWIALSAILWHCNCCIYFLFIFFYD